MVTYFKLDRLALVRLSKHSEMLRGQLDNSEVKSMYDIGIPVKYLKLETWSKIINLLHFIDVNIYIQTSVT